MARKMSEKGLINRPVSELMEIIIKLQEENNNLKNQVKTCNPEKVEKLRNDLAEETKKRIKYEGKYNRIVKLVKSIDEE